MAVSLDKPLGLLPLLIALTGLVTELWGVFEKRATTAAKTLRICHSFDVERRRSFFFG
jgi:hypothetical protein